MAHATTWSAVTKSPVYQTASPVLVPVPVDFAKDATIPPAAVTAAISVVPNWFSTSVGLPAVSNQNMTSGPPPSPVQTSTGSPLKVSEVWLAPTGIVGQVPLTVGSIVGVPTLIPVVASPASPPEPIPVVASPASLPPLEPELPPSLEPELLPAVASPASSSLVEPELLAPLEPELLAAVASLPPLEPEPLPLSEAASSLLPSPVT